MPDHHTRLVLAVRALDLSLYGNADIFPVVDICRQRLGHIFVVYQAIVLVIPMDIPALDILQGLIGNMDPQVAVAGVVAELIFRRIDGIRVKTEDGSGIHKAHLHTQEVNALSILIRTGIGGLRPHLYLHDGIVRDGGRRLVVLRTTRQ